MSNNTSKRQINLTLVALTSLLVIALNVNANSLKINALDISEFANIGDIGQSLECVNVVVGCDGTGSVGSSGDVEIASGDDCNGDDCDSEGLPNERAQLTVIKHVINDNEGTSSANDFTINVRGIDVTPVRSFLGEESPGKIVTLSPGYYNVSETGPSGYTQSLSEDCSGIMKAGDSKVCTITNNDESLVITPSITVTLVHCTDITATERGVSVNTIVSNVSHGSESLTFQMGIKSPTGNFVTYPPILDITIPANAPDPATTFVNISFKSTPDTPAGIYEVFAIIDGQTISTTFESPDCSNVPMD